MLEKPFFDVQVLNRVCENVRRDLAKKPKENDEIDWDVNIEVLFLYAMIGHKPVGVNRHFMMLLIHKKFSEYINRDVSSKVLWNHLDSMYDMAALHESEIIPFPNEEVEFELPKDCHELLESKHGVTLKKSHSDNEVQNVGSRSSKKIAPKLKHTTTSLQSPKNIFATPTLKPTKTQTVNSETKVASSDTNSSVKQETLITKAKVKHTSSTPAYGKAVKSESSSSAKDEATEGKRTVLENNSIPAKKVTKADTNATRKSSAIGTKLVDTPEPNKKIKEKDVVHRKRESSDSYSKKSSVKSDTSSNKKKIENESNKKINEASVKQMKAEVKISPLSSKMQDSLTSSGSKKYKVKLDESEKKVKRVRSGSEESIKKSNLVNKRKRV